MLALDRGEREGFLKVTIQVDAERAAGIVSWMFARKKTGGKSAELVDAAARDAYSRLIHPSLENELRGELSDAAAEGAIKVFGDNLRQLLLQPPIRGKTVMGLDPGYRMGCKVAVVDPTGKVLDTELSSIRPCPRSSKRVRPGKKDHARRWCLKNGVEVHGASATARRATRSEEFAAEVIRELADEKNLHLQYMVVSEAGASVYSAIQAGRARSFPSLMSTCAPPCPSPAGCRTRWQSWSRSTPRPSASASISTTCRRSSLDEALDGVVEDCVNSVGVDLNTASAPLLSPCGGHQRHRRQKYRGLPARRTARLPPRAQLKKVPKLGPKAFEQCAGLPAGAGERKRAGRHRRASRKLRRGQGAAGRCAAITPAGREQTALVGICRSAWRRMGADKLAARSWASASRRCEDIVAELQQARAATRATSCPRRCCAPMCWAWRI